MKPEERIKKWREEGELKVEKLDKPEIIIKEDRLKPMLEKQARMERLKLEADEKQKEYIQRLKREGEIYKLRKKVAKQKREAEKKEKEAKGKLVKPKFIAVTKKEIKQMAPSFPEFLGAELTSENMRIQNEQGGIMQKRFINTHDEDSLVPKFTFPEFGVPDYKMKKSKYGSDLVNTSNGIAPIFGTPSFGFTAFKMPDFSPSENIFKRRYNYGKKKKDSKKKNQKKEKIGF